MRRNRVLSILLLLLAAYGKPGYAQTANPEKYKYVFTVAKDGSGDFFFIQDAINAMRGFTLAPITLYIKNGIYREKIFLPAQATDITFIGENVDSTVIIFNDYSGDGIHSTFSSYTAKISGNRFLAENISFVNDAGRVGQALALFVDADEAVFRNCKFLGNQDTIYCGGENARQYFIDCYMEGTTDFIFGPATVVFKNCRIHGMANSYITAANTPKGKKYGFVFLNCKITADSTVTKLYLGRPWRAHARTSFLYCELPAVIAPEGWDHWGNPENEKTAFYAEYANTGAGAETAGRVSWAKLLKPKEARTYTPESIFAWKNNQVREKNFDFLHPNIPVFSPAQFDKKRMETIALYPGLIPNSKPAPNEEKAVESGGITRISLVSIPSLTVYKPEKPNGQAIIICPGGGYGILAIDHEGYRVAEALNSKGITAFVLKYRIPNDKYCRDKSLAPLQDAQQAIRIVRARAKEWGISPQKIGIMGFSAGGHLASTATTHFDFPADPANTDTISARPDFSILIYPVISFDSTITHGGSRNNLLGMSPRPEQVEFFSNEKQVTKNTPPVFLIHAGDDGAVPVENSIRFYQACIRQKVPAALHFYPKGGHGFGMNNKTTNDRWMDRLFEWLLKLN